jgi:hypothetical protein
MDLKTKTIIFLTTIALLFAQSGIVLAGGFGVSPSSVLNKNLIPGSFFQEDIVLVQSQPDTDLNVVVTINGGKINDWIKIENGNNFIIPKGTQQFPMKVSVTVPSSAELGDYKGSISITTSPVGAQKSGVSVVLGAEVSIDLSVTEIRVSNFSIQSFQIPDVYKGSPIKFLIKVKNDGNVENGPTKVDLVFFDQYHSKQLGQQEVIVTEKTPAFQVKNVPVEFSNNLEIGTYWADYKIYNGDNVIADSKMVFNVVGASASTTAPVKSIFSNLSLWIYLLSIVVIVVIALIIIITIFSNKNKLNK